METLETLAKFTEEFPQKSEGNINYAFLGGTAVRLVQEKHITDERRPISDFDILVFKKGTAYPCHQFGVGIAGAFEINEANAERYVDSVKIRGKDYFYMNPDFLTATKSWVTNSPREKDFSDIRFLYEKNLVKFEGLEPLCKVSPRITPNCDLVLGNLEWFFNDISKDKVKLFATFPRLVNLLDEYSEPEKVRSIFMDYISRSEKNGNQESSIVYSIHSLVREFDDEIVKYELLHPLLEKALKNDVTDFDREVTWNLIPEARYGNKKELVNKITRGDY